MSVINKVVDNYIFERKIGQGQFGEVYKHVRAKKEKKVASSKSGPPLVDRPRPGHDDISEAGTDSERDDEKQFADDEKDPVRGDVPLNEDNVPGEEAEQAGGDEEAEEAEEGDEVEEEHIVSLHSCL